jgi:hypothetical protein
MSVALQEWLRLIPDYQVDPTQPLIERGQELSLVSLPLVWSATES